MVADISGKQAFASTSAHAIVIEALETEKASKALARRLWLSFVGEGRSELYKHDLTEVLGRERAEQCDEIFAALDRDGNGDVSLEEMTALVVTAGQERRNRQASMQDVAQAIGVLDKMLSLVVLVAVALVYAVFFSAGFASSLATLWTTFTGLAFAIGGTVTEFLSCCIFLFVKHPYGKNAGRRRGVVLATACASRTLSRTVARAKLPPRGTSPTAGQADSRVHISSSPRPSSNSPS